MQLINHKATLSVKENETEPKKVIAYKYESTGTIYIPTVYGTETVWLGVLGNKVKVFNPGNAESYTPIYEGDAEFTITIT